MSRRTYSDREARDAQQLLDKIYRHASYNDRWDTLHEQPEQYSTRAVLGHRTFNLASARADPWTLEGLRQFVIGLVRLRMQADYIALPLNADTQMSYCLPQSVDEHPTYRLLMEDPLSLTAEKLAHIMPLVEWTADSDKVEGEDRTNRLYIRTFAVRVGLLRGILIDMITDGWDGLERVRYWQQRIEDENDDDTIFTLRYCGQTKGSPWERHTGDMYSSLETFLGRFMVLLGQSDEGKKVLHDVKVHTVAGAIEYVSQDRADLREQIVIALFRDCLLNTQTGGKDVIIIYNDDRRAFELLHTSTGRLLQSQTRPCTTEELAEIERYGRRIRRYVGKNPSTTQGRVFNDHVEAMIVRQATPAMLPNGSALMVTIASDLGQDHDALEDTFWEAGGRSAETVGRIYNFFAAWEGATALESVDPLKYKKLARDNYLPLVDRYPWYCIDDKDTPKASELLRRYINAAKPMIVVAYGEEQIFAAVTNFADTDTRAFNSWLKRCRTPGYAPPRGVPFLAYFDGQDSNNDPETAVIVIPSLHPGFPSRAGKVKDKAVREFIFSAGVGWCTMSCALAIAKSSAGIPTSRKAYANQIMAQVDLIAGPGTEYHRLFTNAKREYREIYEVYQAASAKRRDAPRYKMPTKIVPHKSFRAARRSKFTGSGVPVQDAVGGWDVSIKPTSTTSFYKLSWEEEDGTSWELPSVHLKGNTIPATAIEKRLLFFQAGLDVRDASNNTLGPRTPLASKKAKSVTLPISMIFLSLVVVSLDSALAFMEHWEDITQHNFIAEIMSEHPNATADQSEGFVSEDFFKQYPSCRSLPFVPSPIKASSWTRLKNMVQPGLPAQPSDLMWLLEQFLLETFPGGGHLDPVSSSEHPVYSVYSQLMNFACRPKYKEHPHNITLRAMAHMTEQGLDERQVSLNILLLALEYLRPGYTASKKHNLRRTLPSGSKIDTVRHWKVFNAGPADPSVVARVTLPKPHKPEDDLGHVSDHTVDSSDDDGGPVGVIPDAASVHAAKGHKAGSSGAGHGGDADRTEGKSGSAKKGKSAADGHSTARKDGANKKRKKDDDDDEDQDLKPSKRRDLKKASSAKIKRRNAI
ncbi:hypothetical protein N0V86_003243 [Didymella sp. IMI 355093]|nr:hypothetical protein N0V86_003243 [Didymella sp. IMI 355093]